MGSKLKPKKISVQNSKTKMKKDKSLHLKECFVRLERLNLKELSEIAEFNKENDTQSGAKSVNLMAIKEQFITVSLSSSDFIEQKKHTKSMNSSAIKEKCVTVNLSSSDFAKPANTDRPIANKHTKSVDLSVFKEQSVTVSVSNSDFMESADELKKHTKSVNPIKEQTVTVKLSKLYSTQSSLILQI